MTGRRVIETERLEAELRLQIQEVRASEQRLHDVLEGVHLVAVSTGLDGRIRFCNRYMCELTGWPREELLGRVWSETFNPESTIVEQLAAGAVADHEDAPLRTRSGELREISWSTTLDRDADGRITGATGIGQDVTERNRAAASLRRLAEEQGALRRVATCVASEADPSRVFDIVAEEVGHLLGGRSANVIRFEPDSHRGTMVGGWSGGFLALPVGSRLTFDGPTAVGMVRRHQRSARVDDYSGVTGEFAAKIRELGIAASVAAPISVGGQLWGAIVVSTSGDAPLASDAEARIEEFAELVALGLASAEARTELAASPARIVAAGDAERRRLERNLHDGAQQRLIALSLELGRLQVRLDGDPDALERLERARREVALSLGELRDVARGIHPAVVSGHGLAVALESLAARAAVPVELSVELPGRMQERLEVAAYYVVSESLTNVGKHAEASRATVDVSRVNGDMVVEVVDDGVGGADTEHGTGLRGLADRVEALGGRLRVWTPRGRGTRVRAELPCA
jgi:PAS domain S-box-containing protein